MILKTALLDKRRELVEEIETQQRMNDVFELAVVYQELIAEIDDLARDSFLMGIDYDKFKRAQKALGIRVYGNRLRKISED